MPKSIEELEAKIKELEKENKDLKNFDPSKLSDGDFEKVFTNERVWKHERFKELNEKAKLGDQLKKEKDEAEQKKLEEDKKFQEALELEKKKNEELQNQIKQSSLDNAIRASASKLGAKNPDTIVKLIDRTAITTDASGSPVGIDDAIKKIAETDKYLFGEVKLGDGTNPNNGGGVPKFKLSEIQNAEFYQKNEAAITEAIKNGQVEVDK